MKVAGIRMTDPWASRVQRGHGVELTQVSNAPVETEVMMEQVAFEHHGPGKNYRPLLHLTGELRSIRPQEPLPYGVEEVTFRAGMGPTVDAFYEFDDAQLATLVGKGYFTEGFEPPASMSGIAWDLPTSIDALVLAPEGEGDTPVVFVTVHGQTELALDAESSGYHLEDYFENNLTPEAQQERELLDLQRDVPTSSGKITDLFSAEEFTSDAPASRQDDHRPGDFPVVRASIFEDLMAEFKENLPAPAEDVTAVQPDVVPDPVETLYQQRIAPGVAKALALPAADEPTESNEPAAKEEAPLEESGLLDLDLNPGEDLGVVPIATMPTPEPVWDPEPEAVKPAAQEGTPAPAAAKPGALQRRVQLALAHEKALDMNRDESESEQELG